MTTATEVRERPIIFSGPMVRAIMEGRKTQTRRVVKPQPGWNGARWVWPLPKRVHHLMGPGTTSVCSASREWHEYAPRGSSPYQPGDLLYVREAFIHSEATYAWEASVSHPVVPAETFYRADYPESQPGEGWSPSIHMPKALARLWLRVTDVRVERVQEITNVDAMAEGVEPIFTRSPTGHYRDGFAALWDRLNAKRGHSWESNPWVWCVEFERADR